MNEWREIDLTLPSPPLDESGNTQTAVSFQLRLYDLQITADNGTIGFRDGDGLMIKGVQVYFDKKLETYTGRPKYVKNNDYISKYNGASRPERDIKRERYIFKLNPDFTREQEYIISADNLTTPEAIKHTFGDTLNYNFEYTGGGHILLNRYVLQDLSGYAVNYFSRHGDGRQVSLLFDVNHASMWNTYRLSQIKLRGVLKDQQDVLSFRSVLQDYDSRLYVCISMSWNAKTCEFESEWQCIYPPVLALMAEDFENLLTESGGTLYG